MYHSLTSLFSLPSVDVPKPKLLEDRDVILKVTGTTVCGSDLHLLHGNYARLLPRSRAIRNANNLIPRLQEPSCK